MDAVNALAAPVSTSGKEKLSVATVQLLTVSHGKKRMINSEKSMEEMVSTREGLMQFLLVETTNVTEAKVAMDHGREVDRKATAMWSVGPRRSAAIQKNRSMNEM